MKNSGKFNKVLLCANIALTLVFTGLLIWALMSKPKIAVSNVSIRVIWDNSLIYIQAGDYGSNIIKDILVDNNDTLKIDQSELNSGYITKINGIAGDWDNGFWWLLEVNGVPADKGIDEYAVGNWAVITFELVSTSYNPWG